MKSAAAEDSFFPNHGTVYSIGWWSRTFKAMTPNDVRKHYAYAMELQVMETLRLYKIITTHKFMPMKDMPDAVVIVFDFKDENGAQKSYVGTRQAIYSEDGKSGFPIDCEFRALFYEPMISPEVHSQLKANDCSGTM